MARKIGMMVTCNRCGRTCFRPEIKHSQGYYEVTEKGWSHDFVGNNESKDLCPHCYAMEKTMIDRFMAGKNVSIPALEGRAMDLGDPEKERETESE